MAKSMLKFHLDFVDEMIVCLNWVFIDKDVLRRGKWAVPRDQYDVEKYPNFCNGAGIAFSRQGTDKIHFYHLYEFVLLAVEAARKILIESSETEPFHLDDVYISGILRKKANISLYHET